MTLDPDLGERPTHGVVVSLLDLGDGTCRLILDDVSSEKPQRNTAWRFDTFYTHKRLDSKQLDAMALSPGELQTLGENVLLRLLALNGRLK